METIDYMIDQTKEIAAAPCPAERDGAYKEKAMSEFEFKLIRDHIHDYCGIFCEDYRMQTLAMRLSSRMMVLDISSFSEYYNYLRFHPRGRDEMADLIPRLTNNETYFFRETSQLYIPCRAAQGKNQTRGHYAFSRPFLRMLVGRRGLYPCDNAGRGWSVWPVRGRDNRHRHRPENPPEGKIAEFTAYSLRSTGRERIERYFVREGEKYRLDERIMMRVKTMRGNLIDQDVFKRFKDMDAILCRNVFIYFSDAAIARAVESFYESLADNGCLLLGHSESLSRITDIFHTERHPNTIVYIKREM